MLASSSAEATRTRTPRRLTNIKRDEIGLTHQFLATMLGVRRPGVTVALSLLERQGLIGVHRGVISLIDRKGLEELSNGVYGVAEAEARRLVD